MMSIEPLRLDVAGLTVGVHLPVAAWRAELAERYAPFLVTTDAPDWTVTVTHDPALAGPDQPWIRHTGAVTTFHVPGVRGWLDLDRAEARVSIPALGQVASALDRTLSYICMEVLPRRQNALLLHAVGIAWDGAGYVFFGASGAGKTTIARLAAGVAQVLVDENVIVGARPGGAGAELCSTPFWGASTPPELIRRCKRRVPLLALIALHQAPDFALDRLTPGEAVMALLTTEKIPVASPASAAAWLAATQHLVQEVPVYRLGFRPTAEVWPFLQRALQ